MPRNKHTFHMLLILLAISLETLIASSSVTYGSDKYKINKSIFGFYLGEHIDALNVRLREVNRNLQKEGYNQLPIARIGWNPYERDIKASDYVEWINVTINNTGYVEEIVVNIRRSKVTRDNYVSLATTLKRNWGTEPECSDTAYLFSECLYKLKFGTIRLVHHHHLDHFIMITYKYEGLPILKIDEEL